MAAFAAVTPASADAGRVPAIAAVSADTGSNNARCTVAGGRDRAGRRNRNGATRTTIATATPIACDVSIAAAATIATARCDDNARCIGGDNRAGTSHRRIRARLRIGQGQIIGVIAIVAGIGPNPDTAIATVTAVISTRGQAQPGYATRRRNVRFKGINVERGNGFADLADSDRDVPGAVDDAITGG